MPKLSSSNLACLIVLSSAASAQEMKTGKERCAELVGFYDRWGIARFENGDGDRNHFRIRASITCARGDYESGIRQIERLLVRRRYDIPRLVGAAPWYPPIGKVEPQAAERP
jgi:hypothetical protein